jgi:hypothetical protein
MEQSFLLPRIRQYSRGEDHGGAYNGDTERQDVEAQRREDHENKDDPTRKINIAPTPSFQRGLADQRVRLPTSVATS